MSDTEIDPAELQAQLDDIKSAMGMQERYPGQSRIWLAYGGIVGGFAIATQLLFALPIPEWGYVVTWLAFAGLGMVSVWALGRRSKATAGSATAPGWLPIVGGLVAFLGAMTWIAQPLATAETSGLVTGAYFFALVIAVGGLGFVLVGHALLAYRIRRRDRWVFYAGGAWMLLFAAVFPNVEWFRYFGYGTFGVMTIGHALASYWLLTRG